MKSVRRKIDLYILSLGLLFVFFIIIATELPTSSFRFNEAASWKELATNNLLPVASALALGYCLFAYFYFDFELKGVTEIPFEISKLEDINYEHLTFLATYVVPLISFDFGSSRQMIVLGLLLVVMGVIYIKTDLFYANPSLALLGFHIYRANGSFKNGEREGIILICRGRLAEKQKVAYIKLDDRIYYVRENA
ncbi:MAG: hypothetical protein H3C26_05865 [Rhodocyclaceae bacterium]|nr:hypothetical protein [Rhodocyclaceae bacterium]